MWAGACLLAALAALAGCGGDDGRSDRPPLAAQRPPGTGRVVDLPCPPSPRPGVVGPNFEGTVVDGPLNGNFVNANFRGATMPGSLNGDFTGADFSGATFPDTNLEGQYDGACFKGVKGSAGSTLIFVPTISGEGVKLPTASGADFSDTDAANGLAVLLGYAASPTVRFRNSVITCVVLNFLPVIEVDLDGAVFDLSNGRACQSFPKKASARYATFHGMDLRGLRAIDFDLTGAEFDGALLDGSSGWNTATFAGASFRQASLKGINFNGVTIVGVDFSGADLEGASFAGANFLPDANGVVTQFRRAHLKFVSFEGASASGVQFENASLYGSMTTGAPSGICVTASDPNWPRSCGSPVTGQTCSCASMRGADLSQAVFTGAFLYGVDFSGRSGTATVLAGTDFSNAVLVAANLKGAQFANAPGSAAPVTRFDGALLQGAQFDATASVKGVSFAGAFVDAGFPAPDTGQTQDNSVYWLIAPETTQFAGWTGPSRPCVHLEYDTWTRVPENTQDSVCPVGQSFGDGCGALVPNNNAAGTPLNPRWKAPGALVDRQGWYRHPSTYEAVTPSFNCGGVATSTW